MTDEAARLELGERRLGRLFRDSLRTYFSNFAIFAAIGFAVVAPAELIVSGAGLGRLTSGFDTDRPLAAELMPQVVQALVTTPLIAAMAVYVLLDLAKGEHPRARRAIQSGLDAFAAVFVPVAAVLACLALATLAFVVPLALAAESALVPTLAIPIFLWVRWQFVTQAVVAHGRRRLGALRASWELTRGSGWRVLGTILLAYVTITWAATLVATPLLAVAKSADSGALLVAFNVVWQALAIPLLAVFSALLYFDLRTRAARAV